MNAHLDSDEDCESAASLDNAYIASNNSILAQLQVLAAKFSLVDAPNMTTELEGPRFRYTYLQVKARAQPDVQN